MLTLGVHTFCVAPAFDPATFDRLLPGLLRHGVGLVEVPLLRPADLPAEEARRVAAAHGVELVCSLGLPARLDPVADPDTALAFLETALETTLRSGARALSGVTYGTIGKRSGRPPSAAEHDGIARYLARAAALARARGLRLGIEPCNRYETHLLNTGAEARALIERTGAEGLFIHLDTYHMAIEEESFAAGFAACGPHLGYVHLSEANRGVPGGGTIAWDAVFSGLAASGFAGPATVESFVFVDDDIAAGLALWRPVAANGADVIDRGLPFLRNAAGKAGLAWTRAAA